MSFTEIDIDNKRWTNFSWFATGGADGKITESVAPGVKFQFGEIRVHLSVAFASVENLTIKLSAIQGSAYNLTVFSQAMSGLTDLLWQVDSALIFLSDDQLTVEFSMGSATNIAGINVLGWAVRG